MSKRPGFMIYHSDMDIITDASGLSLEQIGRLVLRLYEYSLTIDEDYAGNVEDDIRMPFMFMAQHIRDDAEAYDKKVEKTRRSAEARWNANASERMQTHANASERMQHNIIQNNTTQYKTTQNNPALNYSQRADDMKDVMMDM